MQAETQVRHLPRTNGREAARLPQFTQDEPTLGERLLTMVKKPTTTPRWLAFVSHGALVATIIVGLISYGRSAGRTEAALQNYHKVPAIQADVSSLSTQIAELKTLLEKRNENYEALNKRLDAQQQQITALSQLDAKVTSLSNSFGSVWALAQSDSNKMSKLEGMMIAMQNMQIQQQKNKEK